MEKNYYLFNIEMINIGKIHTTFTKCLKYTISPTCFYLYTDSHNLGFEFSMKI
jgi:hypothetical protein